MPWWPAPLLFAIFAALMFAGRTRGERVGATGFALFAASAFFPWGLARLASGVLGAGLIVAAIGPLLRPPPPAQEPEAELEDIFR